VLPVGASVAALAGCPALIFQTFNDSRPLTDMPRDRFSDLDEDRLIRLSRQVQLLTWLLPRLWEDEDLEAWEWGNDVFGTLRGQSFTLARVAICPISRRRGPWYG